MECAGSFHVEVAGFAGELLRFTLTLGMSAPLTAPQVTNLEGVNYRLLVPCAPAAPYYVARWCVTDLQLFGQGYCGRRMHAQVQQGQVSALARAVGSASLVLVLVTLSYSLLMMPLGL
jgi:hypothetical protein